MKEKKEELDLWIEKANKEKMDLHDQLELKSDLARNTQFDL